VKKGQRTGKKNCDWSGRSKNHHAEVREKSLDEAKRPGPGETVCRGHVIGLMVLLVLKKKN